MKSEQFAWKRQTAVAITNSMLQIGCQNGNLVKLVGVTPVCEGAGSNFALRQSLLLFVLWPTALATLYNKFGIVVFWLHHSQWKHCVDQHFQIWRYGHLVM